MFAIGQRVMPSDIDDKSIPAYRNMRGTVVKVNASGWIKVQWDCDAGLGPDVNWRDPATVVEASL